ncbi:MAG: tRNA (adenosine(37)-N6)-threonylcarbamoyltransferase complex ATPase subunit type 1 TsaE [Candidatus Saccharimonadales bacterium]
MQTQQIWKSTSTSADMTVRLGRHIGQRLKGSEIIELISDLGGGKTTLVRGIAAGMGSVDAVASPTFTISKIYRSNKIALHHFDFYRLSETGLIAYELSDVLEDPTAVIVIEWGSLVQQVLPEHRLVVTIKKVDEASRELTFEYPQDLAYMVRDL